VIVDGAVLAAMSPSVDDGGPRGLLLAFYPEADIAPMADVDDGASPMTAEINHGVWIARCPCRTPGDPAPGCIVWTAAPLGWCVRCGNETAGWRWRRILLPGPDERAAIEAALVVRPVEHRNWTPGETVAELLAENAVHGLGVG
jgi:hypothetical protein